MVVASPLNLGRTSSFRSTRQGISNAGKSIQNISGILFRKTKVRRESIATSNILTRKRIENENRAERETEAEAQKAVRSPIGRQSLVNNTGGSLLDRIIGFIGYTALGWFMNNIPTWIGLGKEFIARLQKAGQIISSIANDTIRIVTGFGNVLGAIGKNIVSFDIFDNSKRLETALNDLNAAFFDMNKQFQDGFDLVGTPLTEAKYSGENIPGLGTEITEPGAYPETPMPSGQTVGGGSADFWLLSLISLYENSNPQGAADVAQSIYNRMGYSGRTARQEILARNQYEPVGKFGNSSAWNKVVDRETAIAHIKKYPGNGASVSGLDKVSAALTNASMQQSAAKFVGNRPDFRSQGFERQYDDMTNDTARNGQTFGFNRGSAYIGKSNTAVKVPNFGTTVSSSPKLPEPNKPEVGGIKSIGGGHQLASGASAAFMKMKSAAAAEGINLTLTSSYRSYQKQAYLYQLYKQGKGNLAAPPGTSKHEKGLAIDVANGIPWMQRNAKKFGWKATVPSEDWHFEYLGGGGVSTPPPSGVSAPTISTKPQRQMQQQLTPERTGQDVFVFDFGAQTQMPTPAPSRGSEVPVGPDEFTTLNNFIKKQLLLDLVYL